MKPDTPITNPRVRTESPSPGRYSPAPDAFALREDLDVSTTRPTTASPPQRPPARRRRPSILLALLAALAVAAGVAFWEPFLFMVTATFRLPEGIPPAGQADYRRELLDLGSQELAAGSQLAGAAQWFVDTPTTTSLRLGLTSDDRDEGLALARQLAATFIERLDAQAREARSTPTDGETILSEYVRELESRLAETQEQMEIAMSALPGDDPTPDHQALLSQWEQLRSGFSATRAQLSAASSRLHHLHHEPEPSSGIITADMRRAALDRDDALQQDLKELAVNLAELKLHLLNVWQQTAGPLDRLRAATDGLRSILHAAVEAGYAADLHDRLATLRSEATGYQDALHDFSETWTREFTALRQLEPDPYGAEILEGYQRARTRLGEFLFVAAKHLSAMRQRVSALSDLPSDSARHHVLQSDLVRAFQSVQTAHHRFEFAAGGVETPDNFRLDAALRSARGLRRRTTDRIRVIEDRLRIEALRQAREQRLADKAAAEQAVEHIRSQTDRTVDDLVSLQESLIAAAGTSEAFQRSMVHVELATGRLQVIQTNLGDARERLRTLEEKRLADANQPRITLETCEVTDRPINLNDRLQVAGLGGGLTLLTVLLGQWWVARRP